VKINRVSWGTKKFQKNKGREKLPALEIWQGPK
jgi:hypothetical protein